MPRGSVIGRAGALLLLAAIVPASRAAADGESGGSARVSASTLTKGWQFRVTPYLWFAGFSGTIAAGGRTAAVDAPFTEIFDQLSFAAMADLEARKDRFVSFVDTFYVSLTDDRALSSGLGVKANSKTLVLNAEAGLRVLGGNSASLDALAGIRYWHLKNSLKFESLPGTPKISASKDWVDPVVGALIRTNLSGPWRLALQGDAGGFGAASNLTWQVIGSVGYEVSERTVLNAGYRYLDVDYRSGGFRFDTAVSGLLLGVSFWF